MTAEWDDGVHRLLNLAERMPFAADLDLGDILADDGGASLKPYLEFLERLEAEVVRVRGVVDPSYRPCSPDSWTDYRAAAAALWGDAGRYAYESYSRIRAEHFPELPEQLPIVIGITAYGRCLGLTRGTWTHGPRITMASNAFRRGTGFVDDVMTHECLHAWLRLSGRATDHDSESWYAAVRRLSPAVLGHDLDVYRGTGRRSVRVPNPKYEPGSDLPRTVVRKERVAHTHAKVATWPASFRPAGYDFGEAIPCPIY